MPQDAGHVFCRCAMNCSFEFGLAFCGAIFSFQISNFSAIDILCKWSKNWQIDLSFSKCSSLLLSGNSKFVDVNLVKIGNNVLPALDSVNDL